MNKLKNTTHAQMCSTFLGKKSPSNVIEHLLDERSFEHHLQDLFFRIGFIARQLWDNTVNDQAYYDLLSDLSDLVDKHLDIADGLFETSKDSKSSI